MNQRAQYLIQILDKIGAPLLGAAESSSDDSETAKIFASLLGKVVETSISMNQTLDLTPTDAQDDSLRVALAALAGSLVADQYKQKGKLPEAPDLTRIQAAMSAVLTFGDNFTLSDAHIERLEKLKADGGVVDAHQINIQYVDALIPVINAVGAFPFGQPEQKLIMDVSDRLVRRAAEMRETLLPGLSGDDEKLAELAILRAVANVYAACHEAETKRLTGSDADAPDNISIDPVWQAFETRTAMLEAVAKNIMPESAASSAAAPIPPVAPVETPAAPPAESSPATEPPPTAAPPAAAAEPAVEPADDAGGGNPMSFFGNGDAPSSEPPVPPPQAAAPETPPPPPPPPEPPAEQPSAAPPPAAPTENAGESSGDAGGNPMSFFGSDTPGEDAPAAPVPPPAPPPAEPPQAAPETPPTPPPTEQPPAPPPTTPPADAGSQDESGGGDDNAGDQGGGNPMSFFGKKD